MLVFPTVGRPAEFGVFGELRQQHQETYPHLDVMAEYRKALQWVRDNPSRRKTFRGMRAFLNRWLSNAQDSGRGAKRQPNGHTSAPNPNDLRCSFHAEHYTNHSKPSRRPRDTCDACREHAARNSGRTGEPTPLFGGER